MRHLYSGNIILSLSFLAWASAQILKFFVTLIVERRLDWKHLLSSGGMPSSHASTVCACATSVGALHGWSSPLFAISAVLAAVVMYDAANVRRATGEQAKILNYMMENWFEMSPEIFDKKLKEVLGHTPLQVLMGAILGIAIGLAGVRLFGG